MTDPAAPAIRTSGLTRRFGAQVAVEALDLVVPSGSFYGFLGPNGAGKSTTINMLTGLVAPSAGGASVLGLDLGRDGIEIKRRIGVMPDGLHLFERLSGQEHLCFVGRLYGLDGRTAARRAGELLEVLDLAADARKMVAGYSHGMRKKLALACALIHNPQLLFLDEPFEGIDAVATKGIRDLLARIVHSGHGTVFLTSHVLEIVERTCTHVGIIHRGRMVAQGTLDELRLGGGGPARTLEELFLSLVGEARAGETLQWLG